ncbi:PepSY domain-containing protein [Deinococcus multiflagellatus]|uniref:PepSY domain-containing protein n=1 Tax=Deinococcus multiflagellatus TaxID=1656887 RepID=A0ABW1ZR57_9DEIO|nr:PepSY domain-containing protein [Deinococcus multiflagellatus]MBZ9715416.1 PepSY domain-containing protein [Deinococcus multiflagellatus]
MNKNTRTVLLALATTAAVAVPLVGYAFAQNAPVAPVTATQSGEKRGTEETEAAETSVKSSIQLPAEQPGTEIPDAQEDAQVRALAKITPQQATQAAQAAVPGAASSVKLEDEDGSLVYAVVIGQTEVMVDAGNGQVLHQEAEDGEAETGADEQEGSEQAETNR